MSDTIKLLRECEMDLGDGLKRIESRHPMHAVHAGVVGMHRRMRRLFLEGGGNITDAIKATHKWQLALPSVLSADQIIKFLRERYGISETNDHFEACRFFRVFAVLASQVIASRKLLTATGNGEDSPIATTNVVNFEPIAPKSECTRRMREMQEVMRLGFNAVSSMRENLGLPPIASTDKDIRNFFSPSDHLFLGRNQSGTLSAVVGARHLLSTSKESPPDPMNIGNAFVKMPHRSHANMESVQIYSFASDQAMYISGPTRAFETLARKYPNALMEWNVR